MQKKYIGTRLPDNTTRVMVKNGYLTYPLAIRRDVVDYSTSFEWGYFGSGPAQLATALLIDYLPMNATNPDDFLFYDMEKIKEKLVGQLPRGNFTITTQDLKDAIANG